MVSKHPDVMACLRLQENNGLPAMLRALFREAGPKFPCKGKKATQRIS
jgi:hypothetical protein